MRAVIQRVTSSQVTVDGEVVGKIGRGFNVLIGVEKGDTEADGQYIASKISGLRVFEDGEGKMNLSVHDIGGEILAISQFTLLADGRKGRRPSFIQAELPGEADRLYRYVCQLLEDDGLKVERGIFQADMQVEIHNDGPVTILLDSRKLF